MEEKDTGTNFWWKFFLRSSMWYWHSDQGNCEKIFQRKDSWHWHHPKLSWCGKEKFKFVWKHLIHPWRRGKIQTGFKVWLHHRILSAKILWPGNTCKKLYNTSQARRQDYLPWFHISKKSSCQGAVELLSYFLAVGWMFHSKLEGCANRAAKINSKNQMAGQLFRCNEEKWTEGEPSISHIRCSSHLNWHKISMVYF